MEKKKKDCKLASADCQEANEANDYLEQSKEDQDQSGVGLAGGKNIAIGSSLDDNVPSLNQQCQQVVQWPYPSQPALKQPISLSPSPIILGQWHQSQQQQPYPSTHQPPPHLAQSATPFWLAQQPGYHFAGANVPSSYHPLTSMGTFDINWQRPGVSGGGISARNQPQVPSFCYHVGYPYQCFPGHWDPSSWCGQPQQTTPSPCGACGYFSSLPLPMSGSQAPSAHPIERGAIRMPPKISQKHQQLWEAQSIENIQLWTMVGHLQSELADYKNRLTKLEAETQSLKTTIGEPTTHAAGTSLAGQTSKRGRPKRPVASVHVLPSPDEPRPRARGRRPAQCNAQLETRALNFEKETVSKMEDKEKASHCITDNDGKIAKIYGNNSGKIEIPGIHPALGNQIYQEIPGFQRNRGVNLQSPELKMDDDKMQDTKSAFSFMFQHVKGTESKDGSTAYIGTTTYGGFEWPSNVPSEDCGRGLLSISSQSFYNDGNVTGPEGKVVDGWNFGNGEDASVGLENAAAGSPKDVGEEMEDANVSGAEDIA